MFELEADHPPTYKSLTVMSIYTDVATFRIGVARFVLG